LPSLHNAKKLKELVIDLTRENVQEESIHSLMNREETVVDSGSGVLDTDPILNNNACTPPSQETVSNDRPESSGNNRTNLFLSTPVKAIVGSKLIQEDEFTNWDDVCPNMIRHGYRMSTDYDFRILQREMKNVKDVVSSINLSTRVAENNKSVSEVDIPKTTNYATFQKMEKRTGWLTTVIKGMKADNVSDDIAAQWLITSLGQKYPSAFSTAAEEIGMPVQNETFTPKEFMSMCLKGNINRTGQRALRSFTLWKNIRIFPSEAKVRDLGKGGVVPTTLKLKVGDKMFAVSYKPIDDLVLNTIICLSFSMH